MDEFNFNGNNEPPVSPTPQNSPDAGNTSGTVSGFDSVNGEPTSTQNGTGYTVTSEGGYYTKPKSEIIQDEVFVREEPTQPQGQNSYTTPPPYNPQPQNGYADYAPNPYTNPPKKSAKKGVSVWVVILACVLSAVIGTFGGSAAAIITSRSQSSSHSNNTANSGTDTNVKINVDETVDSAAQAVAKKATKSVVGIRTTTSVMSFFGGSSESTGEGSGVIYTEDGYIITNYHVISSVIESSNSSKIEVFLESNQSEPYQATVVGYNISSDLAVIKIDADGLPAMEIGDSDELNVGQYVITIGNPGGLEFMGSVTYGIISGLNRSVSTTQNVELIQTDAAINPGNSGGALLNTQGQLIGINSSKIVSEEYEGMGFAIPVNTVKEKCDRIISRENEPEPYVGITISEKYTAQILQYYGYPVGAVVLSVDEGSPAYSAGIRRGDIITKFNGTEINDYTMYGDLLNDCEPEETVAVEIYRSGRTYSVNVKIGSNNAN